MMLGAAIGALFNGWLSFRLGRKYSLMAGAILFVGRLAGIGVCFQRGGIDWRPRDTGRSRRDCVLYRRRFISLKWRVKNVRGKMISMYQLMVTLGIVLAFLSDTAFSYSGNWARNAGRAGAACGIANYSGGIPA
ncbi:arabinose-proton symporter [Salmonella enterica subsp. arizonae]|uniref:Arabinose-proton symporter n=1 Tax=Salmonella enterica subsp. arizonae TaxID=59203 RepID=A0A379RXU2_SALER|nr:arabinose-proton symporter [Salmonella enterica subsp. arizonae]